MCNCPMLDCQRSVSSIKDSAMNKTLREMRKAGVVHTYREIFAYIEVSGAGGCTAGEIARHFGFARTTARRYLMDMAADGWIEFWNVPDKRSGHRTLYGTGIVV